MAEVGTVRIKGKSYTVKSFVGTLAETDKQTEHVVSGSQENIKTTIYTHDRFFWSTMPAKSAYLK